MRSLFFLLRCWWNNGFCYHCRAIIVDPYIDKFLACSDRIDRSGYGPGGFCSQRCYNGRYGY